MDAEDVIADVSVPVMKMLDAPPQRESTQRVKVRLEKDHRRDMKSIVEAHAVFMEEVDMATDKEVAGVITDAEALILHSVALLDPVHST